MSDQEEHQDDESQEDGDQPRTEAPEVTDDHKDTAAEMRKSYDDTRPTAVLPGTEGTITGTAVNEWLDDEGNPKFGDPDESPHSEDSPDDESQSDNQQQEQDNEPQDNSENG